MINFSSDKVAAIINGKLQAGSKDQDQQISTISIDSRTLVDPQACLFFALVGERNNGHQYLSELYQKGVRNFVVSQLPEKQTALEDANLILVENTLIALQKLAAFVRNEFQFPVLAITGSNGKTIVKEWLFELLQNQLRIVRSPKSYNSQVGVPLSILNMQGDVDLGILEAGISKPDEMKKLADLIRPEIGVITNVGDAHQENFDSMESKLDEKLKLFEGARLLVFRADQELVVRQATQKFAETPTQLFTWSVNGLAADLSITLKQDHSSTQFRFDWKGTTHQCIIPFQDEASIENACHCLALIVANDWIDETVLSRFSDLQPIAMRLELKQGIHNCVLINDFYNSDINSLEIALQFLEQQTSSTGQKKTVILSDIQQSGFPPYQLYTEVNRLLHLNKVDRLIGVGKTISEHQSVFQMQAQFFSTTREFNSIFRSDEFQNEAILIKGARDFHFEDVASVLQKKYHQTQLEINLNTLVENLNVFKARVRPETKIMVMVKAFSYGSGTVEIARVLEFQKVDYLAVAVADEGIELRQAGIQTPILVMNPEEHSFDAMIQYRLEPNIYSLALFQKFNKVARSSAASFYPIHIKVETGMHRLGFSDAGELSLVAGQVQQEETLRIQTVFSHLAATDEPMYDEFTNEQCRRFVELSDAVVRNQKNKVVRHLLNSAGIERFPQFQFDLVRLGIGLYGISSVSEKSVRPIACWTSTVSQIKNVGEGETVGYGRKGKVERPKVIAVVPVGYADGYDRRFGNGVGKMWVNGSLAPVIGNVCMDMTMIDVSEIDLQVGDLVELMGDHVHLNDLAKWAGTIPYEILTGISQRVKRVYSQE